SSKVGIQKYDWIWHLYFPSIFFSWLRQKWNPKVYRPWDLVDEKTLLGQVPFWYNVEDLIQAKVCAVLSLVEDWELILSPNFTKEGFAHKQISMRDHDGYPSLDELIECVDFIKKHGSQESKVLVHCKSGVGRSACV